MTSLFDKLNLAPAERRLVVIVGIVVFVVLNFWLVFPQFGEWAKNEQRIRDAESKRKTFVDEIARKTAYEVELKELQKQGSEVATEEAALRLSQEINSQAALSGVTITSISPIARQGAGGKTNSFFDEASVTVNINTSEKELIEFLYRLADKDLLIRAKSMNLSPDPSRQRLQGLLVLVKSFQRRPPPKAAPIAAKPAAATAKSDAPKTNAPAAAVAKPVTPAPAPAPNPASTTSTNNARRAPSAIKK
jgi:Tfp pilus assembly protein PilO